MKKFLLTLTAATLVALAGCATPDESGAGNDDGAGLGGDANGGAGAGATPQTISVDGATYECDDTLDGDGICDSYELSEGSGAQGAAVTPGADGTIQVGGHAYACQDVDSVDVDVGGGPSTAGACESYERRD